jgi:membrane protease YdiL (CAAX protease family)
MEKVLAKRYPVTVFFILAFIISWGAIWLIFGSDGIPATPELQQQIGMAILLGPAIAGLLLIVLYDGKKGLLRLGSSLVKWRASAWWYAVALLTAPLSTLVCIELLPLFTSGHAPAIFSSGAPSELLILGIVGGITIGLFEEVGWTGFAVPRLLKQYNIYATGLLIGLLWGAWHFILFWEDDTFSLTIPFLLLLARLFSWLPAYRIIMVWVYKHTQSLLIIILMHASLVASLATLDPAISGADLLIYIVIRAAILWAIVALIALARKRKGSDG